ncbi:MAG: urea ABC transporter permease subunit UrtC [Pyrinomonadaceae bacterium]|nr:urea ABC transporter permease subunit UrtC [Sphingobacteriaceae bacterium]
MKKQKLLIGALLLFLIVMPLLLSDFRLTLLSKFLVFSIVAISINLLWGYTGILSLGHGVYFALGGYAMAMYMKLQTQPLPDFMEWSGVSELPWFWKPFQYLPFALAMVVLLPVFLALLVGIPLFKSGTKGVYFTILSQAITLIVGILFVGQQAYTGGTNGITGFSGFMGFSMNDPRLVKALYFLSAFMLIAVYILSRFMLKTHGGTIIQAIRDRETRLRFLGYPTDWFKIVILATSAGIAGIAGAIFVPIVGIISPSSMSILASTEFAIWVAIGGRATLLGPIVGAIVVNIAKTGFSESMPDFWWYFYGFLFIAATLIFPKGIVGSIQEKWAKRKAAAKMDEEIDEMPNVPIPVTSN